MVVKLDLRIPGKELRNKNEVTGRHLILFSLAALFFISSFLVITASAWRLFSHDFKHTELQKESVVLKENLVTMNKEFERLTTINRELENKLDFMLDDLPSIEFLTYLVSVLPVDLTVESVNMTTSELTLVGKARKEEIVLALTNSLTSSNIIESIELPNIALGANNIYSYTLNCKIAPLLKIKLNEVPSDILIESKDVLL